MKNMVKTICLVCFFTLLGGLLQAHEFWIQPENFFLKPGDSVKAVFMIGEQFTGEKWKGDRRRISSLQLHSGHKVTALEELVKDDDPVLTLSLKEEGTHLLAMESTNAFIRMDGTTFTEYLQEDGLDEILSLRKKDNTQADSASELYSRHTKLLIQVGEKKNFTFKKECSHILEILPEQNPYSVGKGGRVKFKVLFQGKPLFGAKVRIWNRYNYRTTLQNIYAQQDGTVETHLSNPGAWMVSVVKMVPSKDPQAQWQSYWASLVFGVK